jgi:hypothetical protein
MAPKGVGGFMGARIRWERCLRVGPGGGGANEWGGGVVQGGCRRFLSVSVCVSLSLCLRGFYPRHLM